MKVTNVGKWINKSYHGYVSDYTTRFSVFYGGAGSGKSHFVVQKIILKGLQSKRRILVVRKVSATIRESIFKLFIRLLREFDSNATDSQFKSIAKVNKSELTITLINGTEILFKGMDKRSELFI